MLLQLKLFVAKDCKILDTISQDAQRLFVTQPDFNIGYIKNGFPKYKKYYIINIFLIQGSISLFYGYIITSNVMSIEKAVIAHSHVFYHNKFYKSTYLC